MSDGRLTYRDTGVDRQASAALLETVGRTIRSTFTTRVLGDLGHFSGLFHLKGYTDPVLVSTIDGVGTKALLAAEAGRLDLAGRDVVIHGVNDVAVLGAAPLLMLDYVAAARLEPVAAAQVLDGMSAACRDEGVALIGGETAQMPGVYTAEGIDIVGCIIGAVERSAIIDGSSIKPGHVLIGMVATGLHTNGYTLARTVLEGTLSDLKKPLREALTRIRALAGGDERTISRREIREALSLPDSTVRGWLSELVELEYLEADASRGGAGKATRYRLVDKGDAHQIVLGLMTPAELKKALGAR